MACDRSSNVRWLIEKATRSNSAAHGVHGHPEELMVATYRIRKGRNDAQAADVYGIDVEKSSRSPRWIENEPARQIGRGRNKDAQESRVHLTTTTIIHEE